MSAWKEYQAEAEALAKRLGKIIRKRESHTMTRDDPALAQEIRDCIEDVLKAQDEKLTEIQRDPLQLLEVLKEMFGHKPSDKVERDKIDPHRLRMEMHPHDLVRKTGIS